MKNTFFVLFIAVFLFTSCNSTKQGILSGTWKLTADQTRDPKGGDIPQDSPIIYLKQYSGNRFCAITYLKQNGAVLRTIGGTFSIEGNNYIEKVDFATPLNLVNTESIFEMNLTDNKLYITGRIMNGSIELKEVWEKIE